MILKILFTGIVSILLNHWSIAQVAIDKSTLRSTSSILEFNDMKETNGSARGIILPMLSDNSLVQQGALWFDLQSQKVMYKSATENVPLTTATPNLAIVSDHTAPENSVTAGVVITRSPEKPYSSDLAVLKLDSRSTALLLPYVNDVTTDLASPEAGTIAYDGRSKSLAIFNGEHWYFWN
ncbi:hypothetical protein OKE63_09305 [Riemerella anatipestifer]|uniref:hypothetical protein n=1 Tax=Riemerella anatipestifer TaxID=34085 RepID=UPI0021F8FEBD|nr:hypothetical protein [Riemerella anatipestifer]MCW0499361.1 hypothetical protein [Riemerella anatipestifer]